MRVIRVTRTSPRLTLGKKLSFEDGCSFFQLDLPFYTTDEICRQRFITAITLCGEIDADRSAAYIDDDNDDNHE